MLPAPASEHGNSLLLLEGGLTAIAIAMAFAWPRLGDAWFTGIERAFGQLARRQGLAVASVGIATFLIRLAILPFCLIPLPFLPDDFSLMLACNTFAHGRLTNPTPVMWTHFETIHVDMQPTYMSMYFPAQGLVMAAGKGSVRESLVRHPSCSALMCAAHLLDAAGMVAARLGAAGRPTGDVAPGPVQLLDQYLYRRGLVAGLGGALVLGALPGFMKTARFRYGMLMAVGIVLVAVTRPYEGLLLCLPVAVVLGHWVLFGKNRPAPTVLLRRAAVPLLLMVAAGAWMGYYDYRVFGSPLPCPTPSIAPPTPWRPITSGSMPRPEPAYRHMGMRRFYYDSEMDTYMQGSAPGLDFVPAPWQKPRPPCCFLPASSCFLRSSCGRRVLHDRRIRFLILCVAVLMAGMLDRDISSASLRGSIHGGILCNRIAGHAPPPGLETGDKPVGKALVRLTVTLCLALAVVRVFAGPLGFRTAAWPPSNWADTWYGPDHYGTERAQIKVALEQLPGKQLVLVHDSPSRHPLDQWVYNEPDIDASKVVWAWDMDATNNRELMEYYPNRQVWSIHMDTEPATVSPYPGPGRSEVKILQELKP